MRYINLLTYLLTYCGGHVCWGSYDDFNFAGWRGRCGLDETVHGFLRNWRICRVCAGEELIKLKELELYSWLDCTGCLPVISK